MHVPRNKVIGSKSSHVVKNLPAYVSVDVEEKKKNSKKRSMKCQH